MDKLYYVARRIYLPIEEIEDSEFSYECVSSLYSKPKGAFLCMSGLRMMNPEDRYFLMTSKEVLIKGNAL